jgi:hypothetical protein
MLMVCSSLLFVSQLGAEGIGMVTGSSTGTYIAFGQDNGKVAQSAGLDIFFASLTHPAMLQEYLASTIRPSDYPWLDETISTVAVKAMLISFNFSAVRMPIISSAVESSVNWGRQSRRTLLSYSAPAIPNGGMSILARKSAFGIAMPARKWRIVRLGKHFKARTTY